MEDLVLKHRNKDGTELCAVFAPARGLTLTSYHVGDIDLFGPYEATLIGPHVGNRRGPTIPVQKDSLSWPHLKELQEPDPFWQGVACYAAWEVKDFTESTLHAELVGSSVQHGTPLKDLFGQNFRFRCFVDLTAEGLFFRFSVVSESDSLVGFSQTFPISSEDALTTDVREGEQHHMRLEMREAWQETFHPAIDPTHTHIRLHKKGYTVNIRTDCVCQENSWTIYRDPKEECVRLDFVSAQLPKRPCLTVSQLNLHLTLDV